MSKSYRLVIFDWEGTLADTLGPILHMITEAAQLLQAGDFDQRQAREYASLGLGHAIKKLFPQLSSQQHQCLLRDIQNKLAKSSAAVTLVPGARALLDQLVKHNVQLAIATNKGHAALVRALQATDLTDYFKVTRSAGQVPAKPCPQMLEEIMTSYQASPHEAVMIGDSLADIEMAQLAGIDAIGVNFESTHGTDLHTAGAIAVFDEYAELARYLQLTG